MVNDDRLAIKTNKVFPMFRGNNEIVIPWEKIKCIGDEIILVEI